MTSFNRKTVVSNLSCLPSAVFSFFLFNLKLSKIDTNRMTKETLPNTIASNYVYDGMNRLKQLKDVKGTTTLFDRNYTYNTANQISQIAETAQSQIFL
jgi:hypothetical protein